LEVEKVSENLNHWYGSKLENKKKFTLVTGFVKNLEVIRANKNQHDAYVYNLKDEQEELE
jgi:hypothetical protein